MYFCQLRPDKYPSAIPDHLAQSGSDVGPSSNLMYLITPRLLQILKTFRATLEIKNVGQNFCTVKYTQYYTFFTWNVKDSVLQYYIVFVCLCAYEYSCIPTHTFLH